MISEKELVKGRFYSIKGNYINGIHRCIGLWLDMGGHIRRPKFEYFSVHSAGFRIFMSGWENVYEIDEKTRKIAEQKIEMAEVLYDRGYPI